MKNKVSSKSDEEPDKFVEDIHYYYENGLMILTARYLSERGYCCKNNCRNCPYVEESKQLQ